MLERAGAACTVVENGELAVHAALHTMPPFDCILMDCNMPILDGGACQILYATSSSAL
jgi:CheY-like chemotaxis protein